MSESKISDCSQNSGIKLFVCLTPYKAQTSSELDLNDDDIIVCESDQPDPALLRVKLKGKDGSLPQSLIPETIEEVPSLMHEAAKRGNLERLELCLKYQVPVNCRDASDSTPLHWAAAFGHEDCTQLLLEQPDVNINAQNKLGDTPLHLAARRNHSEVVQILVNAGANRNALNRAKKTSFDLATKPQSKALLKKRSSVFDDRDYFVSEKFDKVVE